MDLNRQLKILIDEAPQYGVPSPVMTKAVAPVLKLFAKQLKYPEYYILQARDRSWVITTVKHTSKPNLEKKLIYAFASIADAKIFASNSSSEVLPISIPVTHLLFQMFALDRMDSIVFVETPGNLTAGSEIERSKLQQLIQIQLEQTGKIPPVDRGNIPPNIA
jgi:hypothetical protein